MMHITAPGSFYNLIFCTNMPVRWPSYLQTWGLSYVNPLASLSIEILSMGKKKAILGCDLVSTSIWQYAESMSTEIMH